MKAQTRRVDATKFQASEWMRIRNWFMPSGWCIFGEVVRRRYFLVALATFDVCFVCLSARNAAQLTFAFPRRGEAADKAKKYQQNCCELHGWCLVATLYCSLSALDFGLCCFVLRSRGKIMTTTANHGGPRFARHVEADPKAGTERFLAGERTPVATRNKRGRKKEEFRVFHPCLVIKQGTSLKAK